MNDRLVKEMKAFSTKLDSSLGKNRESKPVDPNVDTNIKGNVN